MTLVPAVAYQSGVLTKAKHERLILDIDQYAERAGIAPEFIWTAASETLKPEELTYLRRCLLLAREGTPGMVYTGHGDVSAKMAAMAGALVRAFVDARVMTAMQVYKTIEEGDFPEATVLLIPNFFSPKEFGQYDTRKIAALSDMLVHRLTHHQPTILKVDSTAEIGTRFGPRVKDILEKMIHDFV